MAWPDQNPPANDVLLQLNVPCSGTGPDKLTYLEIDKLPDGSYRATVGTLFEFEEVCRTTDLEALVRHANAMAGCRSFNDVVNAFRAMRTLGGCHVQPEHETDHGCCSAEAKGASDELAAGAREDRTG